MKKIASILLSLFMVLTLLPTTALAEGGDHSNHCICGANHVAVGNHTSADNPTWQPITDLTSIDASGTYYLSADVTLSSRWTIPHDVEVTLCLNGKTLTANNASVSDTILIEGTLNITDCGSGKITGNNTSNTDNHKAIVVSAVHADCTLNLYGGTITGINAGGGSGGGVHNEGTFNMYGGTITGNTAVNGGGVENWKNDSYSGPAIFNFYGGEISGNTATDTFITDSHDICNEANSTMNANGGTVAGGVVNVGTIGQSAGVTTSTTFNGSVDNKKISGTGAGTGTITGGTFNGSVKNAGVISGGTFGSAVTNSTSNAKIEGGTFNGAVTNYGTVSGGTFGSSGSVTNEMDGSITGGTFNGSVCDKSTNGIAAEVTIPNRISYHETLIWNSITSDTTGCTLSDDGNTLTLSNVHLDVLYVPRTGALTIKINGNVTINSLYCYTEGSSELSRAVTRASSTAGSLTIEGSTDQAADTLYSNNEIANYDGDLTIKNLTANLMELSSGGSLQLLNSKVTVGDGSSSGSGIAANSITMDDTSILVLKKANIFALSENETNNGLSGLGNFLPNGHGFAVRGGDGRYVYTIVESDDENENPVTDITLQRHYNVTFDPNGGTWSDDNTGTVTKRIPINTVLADYDEITAPTKGTDTFKGWFTAATGGNQVTTITEDDTLYAQWDSNGGSGDGGAGSGGTDGGGGSGSDDQTGGGNNGGGSGNNGGTNRPHYVKKTDSTDANSAKTFDAGVAVYGVLAVSAVLGMGYVGKKRF